MAKKKKKSPATGKKSKHRFSNAQREAPAERPSVFEARSGRLKFDILGRKTRGVKGDALKARAAGTSKRKNTLLKEYDASGKANAFVDRRFGEGDASMTPEERSIGRLARARLRQLRPGKQSFALGDDDDGRGFGGGGGGYEDDDDDDDAMRLTHGGAPIDEKREERRSAHALARGASRRRGDESDSDDDRLGGGLDREATAAMHFGGGGDDGGGDDDGGGFSLKRSDHDADAPERRKTKKEVMEELIAKSKRGKASRARQREADEDLLDKLDDEFRKISDSGAFNAALSVGVGHLKPDGWERKGERRAAGGDDGARGGDASGGSAQKKSFGLEEAEAVTLARAATTATGEPVKDDYDKLTRELGLEARGQATDRTKTAEEVEAAEAAALESAERSRLKRMRGDSDDDDDDDDEFADAGGGFAARRAKAKRQAEKLEAREAGRGPAGGDSDDDDGDEGAFLRSDKARRKGGDDLEGNFDLSASDGSGSESEGSDEDSDEGEGSDEDETKAMKKTLGSIVDLERGKRRLRRLGILKDGGAMEEEEEEEEEKEEKEEEDDEDDEEASEEDEEAEEDEEEAEEEAEEEVPPLPKKEEDPSPDAIQKKRDSSKRDEPKEEPEDVSLPFVFAMPETAAQLDAMTRGLTAAETATVLDRVRVLHAPSLKEENRKKTQVFLGLLLQKFETLAGETPLPADLLDAVTSAFAPTAATVPFFAAAAARARLEKMASRLRASLRAGDTGWPPARTFLLLALFADVFPTTDKSHPVTTPAALYLGNVLAHCAVRSRREAVAAVVASALAAAYSAPAGRVFPEAISLLTGLLHAAGGDETVSWSDGLAARVAEQVGGPWLGLADAAGAKASRAGEAAETRGVRGLKVPRSERKDAHPSGSEPEVSCIALPSMLAAFGANCAAAKEDPDWLPGGAAARPAALAAAAATLRVLAAPARATPSARELLAPARAAAERVLRRIERLEASSSRTTSSASRKKKATATATVPKADFASARRACEALVAFADAALAGTRRAPLRWREKQSEAIKQFNPVYEEDGYQKGRDYDPNRERAEARRLQRQLRQEARGAARELRKDNAFLAEKRGAEAAAAKEERGEKQRETLAFLEKMEGDLKSGGQGGVVVKTQRRVNGGRGRDRKKR